MARSRLGGPLASRTSSTLPRLSTVYVAGPMSGIDAYNVPAFIGAADSLRSRGYRVILPADLNNTKHRRELLRSDGKKPATGETWGHWLGMDVRLVADDADAVVVLPGWRKSRGARLETFAAFLCDKPVLYFPTLHQVPRTALFSAWTGRAQGRWAIVPAPVTYDGGPE